MSEVPSKDPTQCGSNIRYRQVRNCANVSAAVFISVSNDYGTSEVIAKKKRVKEKL